MSMELSGNLETVSNSEAFTAKLEGNLNTEVASIPAGLIERALYIHECVDQTYLQALTEAVLEECKGENQTQWASGDVGFTEAFEYGLGRNLPVEIKSVEDSTLKQALAIKDSKPEFSLMESFIEAVREGYEKKLEAEERRLERAAAPRYKITYLPNGDRVSVRVQ